MALFLQKPVFWNRNNYVKPSGVPASSGFPKDNGYGHEEWNNAPRMQWTHKDRQYRVFHTEGVGAAPLEENTGQTFVFLMASHDGIQQLVGVAANAVGMFSDRHKTQRLAICKQLGLGELWNDAWELPIVRSKHNDSLSDFKVRWKRDTHWIPNWICPEEYFWWLDEPVTLDPMAIVGKQRFLNMFGSYTALDETKAVLFMNSIPREQRSEKWIRILDAIQSAPDHDVSGADVGNETDLITDVLTRVNARRGQGRFRDDLMNLWGRACGVTGLDCAAALVASHVKPWAKSTAKERLDCSNGIILSANLDALFDAGLITFEDDGQMRISTLLSMTQRTHFGIPSSMLQPPSEVLRKYLQHHRTEEFLP